VKVDAELSIEGLGDLQAADSLLEDNPRLAEIDRKIESTKHAEEAARKSGLPGFGLGLDYVVVGERSDVDLPDNGKDAVMPMVSVSLPIFRKQYKAARQEAQLMRESFELRKEDVKNTLRADLESAQVQVYQKAELAQLYEKQIVETGHVLELLQEEYANSGADFDEVIRMQQQLISYTKLRAEALAGFHAALARIRYVTAADL